MNWKLILYSLVIFLFHACSSGNKNGIVIHDDRQKIVAIIPENAKWFGVESSSRLALPSLESLPVVSFDLHAAGITGTALENSRLDFLSVSLKEIPFQSINKIHSLQYLYLYNSSTTSADMEQLSALRKLIVLSLNHSNVTSLEFLKNHPHLRRLYLQHTNIQDLQPVIYCKDLQELYIGETSIKDISPLQNLKYLEKLEVNASITEMQINELKKKNRFLKIFRY